MSRSGLALLVVLAGCGSPTFQSWEEEQALYGSSSSSSGSGGAAEDGSTVGTGADGTGDASAGASTADDADDTTTTADATGSGAPGGPLGDAEKPSIVAVELADEVHAAGPSPLKVSTERAGSVLVRVDGFAAGELVAAGGGLFTGALPVRGAIDNGTHEVEIVARQGEHQVSALDSYEVETPVPGTVAWSFTGPTGSRTNRIVHTPGGELIEVGSTEMAGVPRPTLRKRSGISGAELWPEETIVLDTLEGAAVDAAVLPDGKMWVATNVREPNKDPRPKIVLLDAEGHPLGVEVVGDPGFVVRAIAADADGGCFAVGIGAVMGDWDFAYWRISAAGVLNLADTYDYQPEPNNPHTFSDFATDVLIDGDLVWIVGASTGKHENVPTHTRGVLVPMGLDTGEVETVDVIVAPPLGTWKHSAFLGGALDADGNMFTTGYGRDADSDKHRIEISRYSPKGERTWHKFLKEQDALTHGSDVALDSQGRVHVAGVVTLKGVPHGYAVTYSIESGLYLFDLWFPGAGASEVLGMVVNTYDRIVMAGYITTNGSTMARIVLVGG